MKKKIYLAMLSAVLIFTAFGCGKKEEDPTKQLKEDLVGFVNEDMAAIQADKDEAVSIYNSYFNTENMDPEQFYSDLSETAIPKIETYIENLKAIEVETEEVAALKELYLQGSQKQYEAMQLVALSLSEENPDYLVDANARISESKSYFIQYESQLKILAIDNGIEIVGSFSESETDSGASGQISEVPQEGDATGQISEVPQGE